MPDETQSVLPSPINDHDKFGRVQAASYDEVTEFLKNHVYFTAREWAVARLCADFRTKTGIEMTTIGESLPDLVPFMTESYSPQAVYAARRDFEDKVRKSGASFLYGAYSGFFTAEEVDDIMYEATETAKFLLEIEGTPLAYGDESRVEDRARTAMHTVHQASLEHRYDECPHCGEQLNTTESER